MDFIGSGSSTAQDDQRTILVVDDAREVLELLTEFLSQAGYFVLAASNGPEAVTMAQSHPGAIHLLITDVLMPGMSGSAVAEQVRRSRPGMKLVYCSGYLNDEAALRDVFAGNVPFIQKPFTLRTLNQTVLAALGHSGLVASRAKNESCVEVAW